MTKYLVKEIVVGKHKFNLEVYPIREGCNGKEGPYFEIFPHDYNAALYAFSNKERLNKLIKKKHLNENNNIGTTGNGKDHACQSSCDRMSNHIFQCDHINTGVPVAGRVRAPRPLDFRHGPPLRPFNNLLRRD